MFLTFKKWTALYILCLLLLFLGFAAILWHGGTAATAGEADVPAEGEGGGFVLVLDPGHGGEDGGAVSADGGTVESQINLEIALELEALAQLLNMETVMTRREDISIYSQGAETLREKKVSDLKNRVELINGVPGAVLVSIHQNSMPSAPEVQGAQVFYNTVEGSEALAVAVQDVLNASVNDPERAKSPKAIGDGIYLMKNVTVPAVLVECGFLSNAQEAERLGDPAYQKELAAAILAAVLSHCGAEN